MDHTSRIFSALFQTEDIATLSSLSRVVEENSTRSNFSMGNILELSRSQINGSTQFQIVTAVLGALELSYDGIWITDRQGSTIYANEASRQFYDMVPDEVIGRNVEDLIAHGYFDVCASRDAVRTRAVVTRVIKSRTGKELLVTAKPVFDSAGEVAFVVSNVRDITRWQIQDMGNVNVESYSGFMKRYGIVFADDSPLVDIVKVASRVAKTDCTVLLEGESGVGKEVFARFIHQYSQRRNGPFEAVNCGAIPEALFESEMFGHEKGAFTGAIASRPGAFERARGGTLFLDEVSEIPLSQQVKLLRVLQEGEVRRLGSKVVIKLDARVVVATNRNLEACVKAGAFRSDLYYRLNVIPLFIPPLRDRKGDIKVLLDTLLERFNRKYESNKVLSPDAEKALLTYRWPGNVREMMNLIERLVVISPKTVITLSDLPEYIRRGADKVESYNRIEPLKVALERVERKMLIQALREYGSSRRAAQALKVTHSTICRKAKKYGLPLNQ